MKLYARFKHKPSQSDKYGRKRNVCMDVKTFSKISLDRLVISYFRYR